MTKNANKLKFNFTAKSIFNLTSYKLMLATDVFVQFNKFFYLYSINLKKKLQILSQQTKFTICMIVFL